MHVLRDSWDGCTSSEVKQKCRNLWFLNCEVMVQPFRQTIVCNKLLHILVLDCIICCSSASNKNEHILILLHWHDDLFICRNLFSHVPYFYLFSVTMNMPLLCQTKTQTSRRCRRGACWGKGHTDWIMWTSNIVAFSWCQLWLPAPILSMSWWYRSKGIIWTQAYCILFSKE
jgi:hypothetical protein